MKKTARARSVFLLVAALFVLIQLAACGKKDAVKDFNAEDSFSSANALLDDKKYEEARKLFNEIKARDFGGPYGPLASLRIADSYQKEGEPELAVTEYKRFIDLYPGHKFAPYAQFQTASIYFKQVEDIERGYSSAEKALAEFESLMERYPRNPYADEALEKIEKLREMEADHEFMVGEFYFKKGAYKGALGRFIEVLEKHPGYRREADVLNRITISYGALGDEGKSAEYLKALGEKYPGSKALEDAQKALAQPKLSDGEK